VSAASVANRGRTAAESLMVDTIVFTDDDGGTTFDPNTGTYTDTAGTVLYDGPCQVQVTGSSVSEAVVGEQQLVVERIIVKIPWDAPDVPVNSVGTITAAGPSSGSVVGRRYRVIGSHDKTFATATRLPVELVST
jgi:hypothetical protein